MLLRESGIRVSNAYRIVMKQAGGSHCLGYGLTDVYNKFARFQNRKFDGGDANSLIEIFNRRCKYEDDFHFATELDENNCVVSFCWRDKQFLEDHMLFGDLVVFDTKYRTNKYNMICAPFITMNHPMNAIFCCGFFMNNKIG